MHTIALTQNDKQKSQLASLAIVKFPYICMYSTIPSLIKSINKNAEPKLSSIEKSIKFCICLYMIEYSKILTH